MICAPVTWCIVTTECTALTCYYHVISDCIPHDAVCAACSIYKVPICKFCLPHRPKGHVNSITLHFSWHVYTILTWYILPYIHSASHTSLRVMIVVSNIYLFLTFRIVYRKQERGHWWYSCCNSQVAFKSTYILFPHVWWQRYFSCFFLIAQN